MPTDETTLEALAALYEREAAHAELRNTVPRFARSAAEARLIADALRFRLVGTGEAELPAVRLAPQYDDATVAAFLEEAILQYSVDDAADSLLLDWAGVAAQRLATLADAPRMVTEEMVTLVREAAQKHEPRLHEVADALEALTAPAAQEGAPESDEAFFARIDARRKARQAQTFAEENQ